MRIRLKSEILRELQIQFLKPLFRRKSSSTIDSQRFLSRREIFALTLASTSIAILFALGYLLTGWNLENFKGNNLAIMLVLIPITLGFASNALQSGFKPRFEKYFKKSEPDSRQVREHTKNLYKEVYKPLCRIFAEPNPRTSYTIVYSVPHASEYGQSMDIPFNELPHWERGIAHLRTGKPYRGVYKVWEDALTQKREFNDLHLELRQEVKKLIVQKMQERFSSFHEHKYPTSQEVQGYFYSEGLVNVLLYEIKLLLQDSELKPDFKRHFDMTDWNSFDGHWWLLEREGHKLLQTRDPWTDDDADKLTTTLIEIESNPQILQASRVLFERHREIRATLWRFRKEIKTLVDPINDIEDNYIIQGKCEVGY